MMEQDIKEVVERHEKEIGLLIADVRQEKQGQEELATAIRAINARLKKIEEALNIK